MSRVRLLRFLRELHERGPVNAYAVAFILTESHFRGPMHRLFELAYALTMINIFCKTPKVTLGKCQVGLAYWQSKFGTKTSALVRAVFDDISNYEICCDYLNSRRWSNLKEVSIHYNGKPSRHYAQLLQENLRIVILAMERLKISRGR